MKIHLFTMTAYLVSKKVLKNNSADGKKKFSFCCKKSFSAELQLYLKTLKNLDLDSLGNKKLGWT